MIYSIAHQLFITVSLEHNESGCSCKRTPGGSGGEGLGHVNDAFDEVVKVAFVFVGQIGTGHVLDHGPVVTITTFPVVIIVIIIDFTVVVVIRAR